MSSWPYTVGAAQPSASASASNSPVPKTWSMWWCENTAAASRPRPSAPGRQARTTSKMCCASNGPPVSSSTRPSPVSIAVMLATLFT